MDLIAKLQKLRDQQAAIEQKIAERQSARNAVLGSIFPLLLTHPNVRKFVAGEGFQSKLSKAQVEALVDALKETSSTSEITHTDRTTDAGGVLGGPKTEASAALDAGQQS